MSTGRLNYLDELEAEAIFILREVYAKFNNPIILFSGGKDSIVLTQLAKKAFYPMKLPFKLLHIDTGHNFPETISFRDKFVTRNNLSIIIGSVEQSIREGKVQEEKGKNATRNALQTRTLLDVIQLKEIDCAIGGARRDEEKSRAKERIFSHRNKLGEWDPKNQRPELWNLYNGKHNHNEHFRVFPLSNWTELDVWNYIDRENIEVPSLYFSHNRNVVWKNNCWLPVSPFLGTNEKQVRKKIRFRTLGDITITGGIESEADTVEKIIHELRTIDVSERGNRSDDKRSEAAMENRKRKGYF